jgi:hypothetical protein
MIKLENAEVFGWEHTIRGMRNPKNSWDKMDSYFDKGSDGTGSVYRHLDNIEGNTTDWMTIGPNDHNLMMGLAKGGPVHGKYRRMLTVYLDITAPLYWWKEFDTYKVGTVANSCSTMHKIHAKRFTRDDFSCEHLLPHSLVVLDSLIATLNQCRDLYLGHDGFKHVFGEADQKDYWWQMIQLLPTSYNQKRTVMLNYEVLHNIYYSRKNHKLDEWHVFCDWIESLPYSEIITCKKEYD